MRTQSFVLLAAFLLPLPMAAETTYYYVGNNLTSTGTIDPNITWGNGPYTTSDSVTGWFTASGPLFSMEGVLAPDSFSFSDGVQTISSAAGGAVYQFALVTDASGNILDWITGFVGINGDLITALIETAGGPLMPTDPGGLGPIDCEPGACAGDEGIELLSDGSNAFGQADSTGSWSMNDPTAIPEPSSFVLLITGLAGMAGVARRKLSR